MRNRLLFPAVTLLSVAHFGMCGSPVDAAEAKFESADKRIALSLHAGPYDRSHVFVSVLIDAGKAKSVFVEYADGKLGRAQLVEPGMLNASARGQGKKELHFVAPKMAKGETARVVAALSDKPVEGRTYVWSGEPRQSRRVSCGQCHQGLSFPTAEELRQERQMLETTGKVPPLELPRILPTSKGHDSRWHEKLGKYLSSACWECHARHMVQYEYGQSLDKRLPWAPDPPQRAKAADVPAVQSVFHTVFRVRGDRAVSHPLPGGNVSSGRPATWAIHYGFELATLGGELCSSILQQHATTLSEEAGKFIGRHNVLIDWIGVAGQKKKTVAREERQLTVKDYRGRNKSYAMWIDFVSTLKPVAGTMRLDGAGAPSGFRFVPTFDDGSDVEYRESADWRAMTFVSEGTTYTAVCVNHRGNPKPLAEQPANRDRALNGPGRGVGYTFVAEAGDRSPLLVHYRLWIQGGRMPSEEIQAMANDFVEPIRVEVK